MATEQVKVKLSAEGQKQVVSALKSVQKQAVKTGKQGAAGIGLMNGALSNLKTLLPALGIAAAVTGFAALIKNSLDVAEASEKISQRTGVTVETLTTLAFAAELAGSSYEVFTKGLIRASRTLSDANAGLTTALRPFQQLDIAITNTDGSLRDVDKVLFNVADRFKTMSDGTKKTALALEIFGRAGAELIPLLNEGSEGLAAMQEEARGLGLEISTNTAAQAAVFKDNISRLSNAFVGIGNILLAKLLPSFVNLTDSFVAFVKDGEAVQKVADFIVKAFKVIAAVAIIAAFGIEKINQAVQGLTGSSDPLIQKLDDEKIALEALAEAQKNFGLFPGPINARKLEEAKSALAGFAEVSRLALGTVKPGEEFSSALIPGVSTLKELKETLSALFSDLEADVQSAAATVPDAIDDIFTPRQTENINAFDQQIEKLRTNIRAFGEDAGKAAEINASAAGATDEQADAIRELVEQLELLREAAKGAAESERQLTEAQEAAADAAAEAQKRRAEELAEKIARETVTLAEVGQTAQDILITGFERLIVTGEGFRETIANLIRSLAALFARMILFRIFGSFFGSLFGGGGTPAAPAPVATVAHGGLIRGPGGPTSDSILARLSAGEFVVRASSVAQPGVLGLLTSINTTAKASAPGEGFAAGGLVTFPRSGRGDINVFVDAPGAVPGSELIIEQATRKAVKLALLAQADQGRRS